MKFLYAFCEFLVKKSPVEWPELNQTESFIALGNSWSIGNSGSRIIKDPYITFDRNRILNSINGIAPVREMRFPYLFHFIQYKINSYRFEKALQSKDGRLARLSIKDLLDPQKQSEFSNGWKLTKKSISGIDSICKKRGMKYIICLVPMKQTLQVQRSTPPYPHNVYKQLFQSIPDVQYIDLYHILKDYPVQKTYFQNDPHWSPLGHWIVAEALYQFLGETKVLNE